MAQLRTRRSQEEWLELIQECRSSGMTDRDWCDQHGIVISSFYNAVKRLRIILGSDTPKDKYCHRKWGKDMQSRPNGKREDCTEMETTYNADAVGAYNILRKYHSVSGVKRELSVTGLKTPEIIKVAV